MLVRQMDMAFDKKSWHGTNLRGSLRNVALETALYRPAPERRNIWEIVLHAAYWKYTVWRRLRGAAKSGFARKGSNWFAPPDPQSLAQWEDDVKLLGSTHRQLREAVSALTVADLEATPAGSKVGNFEIVSGIIAHDLYHAGQIQALKRLAAASKS